VTLIEDRTIVVIDQCWGCGRFRGPKWVVGWLPVLRAEGRLRYREFVCDDGPGGICLLALMVMDPDNKAIPKKKKVGKRTHG